MVRYDKCVEYIYDQSLIGDRTKTLQIIKVMKGAISMSKSRTGECIFRTNKSVKKDLERLVNIEVRNSNYSISRINTNKKFVVDRWSRMLENYTSCSPQTLFEETLGIIRPGTHQPSETDDDHRLKSLIDLRLEKLQQESSTGGFTPRSRRGQGHSSEGQGHENQDEAETKEKTDGEVQFVTERKEIRNKYSKPTPKRESTENSTHPDGTVLVKSTTLHLPPVSAVRREVTYAPMTSSTRHEEEPMPVLERDLTDWNNWALKDKSWITGYIHREKTKHEDLIIRNALTKIENEMSGANMIKRHQLRQKIHNDHTQREIEQRKKERMRREREQTRELSKLSSVAETSKEPKDKKSGKKHVGFCDPVVRIYDEKHKIPRKTLRRAKDGGITLPLIAEDSTLKVQQIPAT